MTKLKDKDYLNGEAAKEKDIHTVIIITDPIYENVKVSESKTKEVVLMTVKDEKETDWSYTPNRTTRDALKKEWGAEMSDWINKKISLDIKEEKVMGKDKLVVYGKPYVEPK